MSSPHPCIYPRVLGCLGRERAAKTKRALARLAYVNASLFFSFFFASTALLSKIFSTKHCETCEKYCRFFFSWVNRVVSKMFSTKLCETCVKLFSFFFFFCLQPLCRRCYHPNVVLRDLRTAVFSRLCDLFFHASVDSPRATVHPRCITIALTVICTGSSISF